MTINGNSKVRAQLLHGVFFLRQWHAHDSHLTSLWRCWLTAVASPLIAFNFFMAEFFCRRAIATVSGGNLLPQWHPHGSPFTSSWRRFDCAGTTTLGSQLVCAAVASAQFAVDFFTYHCGVVMFGSNFFMAAPLERWHCHGSRSASSLCHCGASLPRWHPHGSRSTSSWWCVFPAVALLRSPSFTAVVLPRSAVNFLLSALFSGMALSRVAVRFLIVSLWSFFAAVASPRFAVNFFMVACFRRWYSQCSRSTMCALLFLHCDAPRCGDI